MDDTNKKLILLETFFSCLMINSCFLFLTLKKKLSMLDDVSFENFLIRRLYVKGPYNPFVLALMRNKITPEAKKKKKKKVHCTHCIPQSSRKRELILNRHHCQVQAQLSCLGIWCPQRECPHPASLRGGLLEKYFPKDKEFALLSLWGREYLS